LSSQDTIQIVGEMEVCVGGCYEYSFNSNQTFNLVWTVSGPNGLFYTNNDNTNSIIICFDIPGTYLIEVSGMDEQQAFFYSEIVVFVFDFIPAEILSTASQYCALDSLVNGCEKVCEGAVIEYFIYDPGGNGGTVEWQVSGAESFEQQPNGNLMVTWGNAGFGLVQANVAPNFPGCEKSSAVCVEIIGIPEAIVETIPSAINGVVTICRGQTVYIENYTTGAVEYEWQTSNGLSSDDYEPNFNFPVEGIYTINYMAGNECGCTDSLSLSIEVLEGQSPFVDCVGTICENESAKYSSDADCTLFIWSISSNGTIINGGGPNDDFITVDWGVGPEGWIFLETDNCNGDYCNEPAMIRIPIISDDAKIQGPARVCKASTENYEIADYEATAYFWTVSSGNNIISGQGSNQISVQWKTNTGLPSFEQIIVEYDNCYLQCSGKDTLNVIITDAFFVEGPFEVCPGVSSSFKTRKVSNISQGVTASWEIYGPNEMLYWSSASTIDEISIVWPDDPGMYLVRAIPVNVDDYCNDQYQITISLSDRENEPDNIIGEFDICQGNAYEYEASSPEPNNTFTWYIEDGPDEYSTQGNPIVITWNSTGPYTLGVSQTDYTRFPCESETYSVNLEPISGLQINGNVEACLEDVVVYRLDPLKYVNINWDITPSNAGTIISGQGSNEIEVQWNSLGNHLVKVTSCALNNQLNVLVNDIPFPSVIHPLSLCDGELASITTSIAYISYRWLDENQNEVSILSNPGLPAGYYQVEVTDSKGCKGYESFYIEEFIKPEINISTPDFVTFCSGPPWPVLYAMESDPAYSYQWYKNGSQVGGNNSILNADDFATYYVEIIDFNGCTNTSNIITITEDCGGGGGGGNPGCSSTSGSIDFSFTNTADCNIFDFQNNSLNFLPGSLTYFFGDPVVGSSTLENPQFTFPSAGFQKVLLLGQIPDDGNPGSYCLSGIIKIIEVPIAPDFDFEIECSGEVSSFENRSSFLPGEIITSWTWDLPQKMHR